MSTLNLNFWESLAPMRRRDGDVWRLFILGTLSGHAILPDKPTRVEKTAVLDWFGSMSGFIKTHQAAVAEQLIAHLLDED